MVTVSRRAISNEASKGNAETRPNFDTVDMKDVALAHRMARPSLNRCDEGKLILFPDSTHWVQPDAAEEVNYYLIDLLLDRNSKR